MTAGPAVVGGTANVTWAGPARCLGSRDSRQRFGARLTGRKNGDLRGKKGI